MDERHYYVYILTNVKRTVLYIGITNNLIRRVWEHQEKFVRGFTERYHCTVLIYYEQYATAMDAIEREKQLKRWSRIKKLELIRATNPALRDLYPELC
ncbi:MAG: GIY-YIG nuclease family protein [bacterium]|nr:GIY-YIG nuclease family protein [bacterium]